MWIAFAVNVGREISMKTKLMAAGALIAWECWAGAAAAESAALQSPPAAPPVPSAIVAASPSGPDLQPVEREPEVLMRSSVPLGGYGGPDMRMTSIFAEPAMLVGAQASWLVNHQYFFGVAGYGLATRHDAPNAMRVDGNPSMLGLVYGGIRMGVVATPSKLLHVTLGVLAGPGSLTGISRIPTRAEFEVGYERRMGHAEAFLVLEPEVAVEANATSFMRVALGASYRYVTGLEHPGLSTGNLSSPAASLAVKFGVF
jgi:hypothetical protein